MRIINICIQSGHKEIQMIVTTNNLLIIVTAESKIFCNNDNND